MTNTTNGAAQITVTINSRTYTIRELVEGGPATLTSQHGVCEQRFSSARAAFRELLSEQKA